MQQFVSTLDLQDRLDPRESFFGGRTNAIKLHYKVQEDETIQYYDFTSLYPWTNKYCRYPVVKIKQEASGFPPECDSEESKREYIRHYKEKEGIDLEYDKIQKNPGLRCLSKLCLNSFWGKFGQRRSMNQSMFFHESETEKFFSDSLRSY